MTKWEYAWLVQAMQTGVAKLLALELNTERGTENLLVRLTNTISELNKLGKQGWEVVSVRDNHVSGGTITTYFLKRPLP